MVYHILKVFLHIGFPFCKGCAKNTFWSDLLLTCVQFVDVRIGYFFTRFISKQHLFHCLPKNITRNGFLMLISSATEARVMKTCLTGISLKSVALSFSLFDRSFFEGYQGNWAFSLVFSVEKILHLHACKGLVFLQNYYLFKEYKSYRVLVLIC